MSRASAVCAIALFIFGAATFGALQEKGKKDEVRKVVEKLKGGGTGSNTTRRKKRSRHASDKNKAST
ncbi:MAG TPA: hypothetical protein VID27_03195, partial [Blastocatellia bacterium]